MYPYFYTQGLEAQWEMSNRLVNPILKMDLILNYRTLDSDNERGRCRDLNEP